MPSKPLGIYFWAITANRHWQLLRPALISHFSSGDTEEGVEPQTDEARKRLENNRCGLSIRTTSLV